MWCKVECGANLKNPNIITSKFAYRVSPKNIHFGIIYDILNNLILYLKGLGTSCQLFDVLSISTSQVMSLLEPFKEAHCVPSTKSNML